MTVVVAPYNPWKENIAAQIGMMLASKMLEQYQSAEAGRKFAAILQESGNWTGADEDARALNEVARQQMAESGADARLGQPVMAPAGTLFPAAGGVPVALPGASPMAAGVPGQAPTLEQLGSAGFNVNEYDPRLAPYLSKAQQPGGIASRAPETPNFNLVKMMELLSTPRFAAYSGPIMDQILKMQSLYGQRREGNWKDWKTLVEAMGASAQGQTLAASATGNLPKNVDLVKLAAAQGTHLGPPHQAIWEQEKSRVADADSKRDYGLGMYISDNNLAGTKEHAQAIRDSAAIQANAYGNRGSGGSGYQPYDRTKRDAMNFFTTTRRDIFNQEIKAYGPAPTQEQVATAMQRAHDKASGETAKMYPDSPFAAEFNRAENEKREVAEFTAMAMGNPDFFKALSDAARQGEAAVRRVANQALLPNGRKPSAAQIESLVEIFMGQVKPSGQGDTQKTPQMPYTGAWIW